MIALDDLRIALDQMKIGRTRIEMVARADSLMFCALTEYFIVHQRLDVVGLIDEGVLRATLDVHTFGEVVRRFSSPSLHITISAGDQPRLTISAKEGRSSLVLTILSDSLDLPSFDNYMKCEIDTPLFLNAIERVLPVADENTRIALECIFIRPVGDTWEFHASDSYSLFTSFLEKDEFPVDTQGQSLLIHYTVAKHFLSLNRKKKTTIYYYPAARRLALQQDKTYIIIPAVDVAYPNIDSVIVTPPYEARVSLDDLRRALITAQVFNLYNARSSRFTVDAERGQIDIFGRGDLGDALTTISMHDYRQQKSTGFAINSEFMLKALRHLQGDIVLRFGDAESPVSISDNEGRFRAFIMTMTMK